MKRKPTKKGHRTTRAKNLEYLRNAAKRLKDIEAEVRRTRRTIRWIEWHLTR